MAAAGSQCDAMLFVVNPLQVASIEYFRKAVDFVPGGVPVAVVMTTHEGAPERLRAGAEVMKKLCSGEAEVRLEELAVVAGEGAALPPLAATGLNVELFPFRPNARPDRSSDLLDATACNPASAARRQSDRWNALLPKLVVGGLLAAAVAGGAAAYHFHAGTHAFVDAKVASWKARLSGGK